MTTRTSPLSANSIANKRACEGNSGAPHLAEIWIQCKRQNTKAFYGRRPTDFAYGDRSPGASDRLLQALLVCTQFGHNCRRRRARIIRPVRRKRDRTHPRMSAAAIALADRRQVHHLVRRPLGPRIRPHRHTGPAARLAQANVVRSLWIQEIRNELVVALELAIRDVEVDRAVLALGPLA